MARGRDAAMRDLMAALMRASAMEVPAALRAGTALHDTEDFCGRVIAAELGALLYERLGGRDDALAPEARARLERAAAQTREQNAALLGELERISARLGERAIPFLVVKGPALAQLTVGLRARPFHDLDLLVHGDDFQAAADALRSLGFTDIVTTPRHDYHRIFARRDATGVTVVELHFDLGDGERGIVPDVAGIWQRSTAASLDGCEVCAPGTTDHLLLTVMQLPHHGWTLRLLLDIGLLVSLRPDQIDWRDLPDRARGWGMWALTASTLYVLDVIFGVPIPEPVRVRVRPQSYFRRAQWRLVVDTVTARLGSEAGAHGRQLAPLLLLDHVPDIAALVRRRAGLSAGQRIPSPSGARTTRRVLGGAWILPALAALLIRSIVRSGDPGPAAGR